MIKSARTAPTSRLPLGFYLTLLLTLAIPIQSQAANFGLEQQIAPDVASRHELANFGGSVAIDGDTAVVGAFKQNELGNNSNLGEFGAVYVYERDDANDETWEQVTKLTAPSQTNEERFGWAVAIKNEAIIVGAPHYDDRGKWDSGRAFIFSKTSGSWDQSPVFTLEADDNIKGAQFGYAVDIANQTNNAYTFVVGAWGDDKETDSTLLATGSVYVYQVANFDTPTLTANTVNASDFTAKLIDHDGNGKVVSYSDNTNSLEGDTLGNSVAISSDATIIVAGAFGNQDNATSTLTKEAGTVFVWQQTNADWKDLNHLTPDFNPPTRELNIPTLSAEDRFGASVDVNDDGSVIVVGSRGLDYLDSNNSPIFAVGAVYLFNQPDKNWSDNNIRFADRRLTAITPIEGDRIGASITIAPDSSLIASGMSDFGEGHSGRPEKVLVWHKPVGGWVDSAEDLINDLSLIATDRPIECAGLNNTNVDCDYFGASVSNAVWTDGSTIIVGAAGHNNLDSNNTTTDSQFGIAYIYTDTTNVTNAIPMAVSKSVTFDNNASGPIELDGSDTDVGDTLEFIVVTEPVKGSLTGTAPDLTYQTDVASEDYTDTFVFKVYDGTDFSDEATITITVGNPSTGGGGSSGGGGGGAWSIYLFAGLFLMPFFRRRIRDSAK